jgi:hypothetical protein
MINVKEIIQSWYRLGFADEEIQKIAQERMETCNSCSSKKEILGVPVCGECYCPLAAKTFSPENSCPLKKWKR